jgi:hypothetical protein
MTIERRVSAVSIVPPARLKKLFTKLLLRCSIGCGRLSMAAIATPRIAMAGKRRA